MQKLKSSTWISFLGLALYLTLSPHLQANTFDLGEVTQAHGETTFFPFFPPFEVKLISPKERLKPKGSYLTHDSSHFTAKLFDGSWLRVSPKTKFTLEYEPTSQILTVHLYTGSLKILFSTLLNQNKMLKLVVKSSDASYETVDGKFSVVRNPLTSSSSVYVEKGIVMTLLGNGSQIVHSKESLSVKDRDSVLSIPAKMSDKEVRFLNSKFYLQEKTQEE